MANSADPADAPRGRVPYPLVGLAVAAVLVALLVVGAMHAAAERSDGEGLTDGLRVAALGVAGRTPTSGDLERLVADPRVGGASVVRWDGAGWRLVTVVAEPGGEPTLDIGLEQALQTPKVVESGRRVTVWVAGPDEATLVGVASADGWLISAERRRLRLSAGLLALATGALAAATLLAARMWPDRPTRSVAPAARRVTEERGEELGLLGRRYDTLARTMAERSYIRDTLGRYLGDRVAESLGDGHDAVHLPAARLRVAVLDLEAIGLPEAADAADPSIALAWVDEINREISRLVDLEGGRVADSRPGGAIAVFGAPTELAEPVDRALRCGAAVHDRIRALLREWERGRRAPPGVEIFAGVHVADVVAGNIGTMQRLRYGIVGSATLRAAEGRQLAQKHGAVVGVSPEAKAALVRKLPLRQIAGTGWWALG